jgi:hypothetical protein
MPKGGGGGGGLSREEIVDKICEELLSKVCVKGTQFGHCQVFTFCLARAAYSDQ